MIPTPPWNDTFSFCGLWHLRRAIRPLGRFQGTALVTAKSDHDFLWQEAGTLTLADGQPLAASRTYRFVWHPASGQLHVLYADSEHKGDLLHCFDIKQPKLRHQHLCAADCYSSQLFTKGENQFFWSYRVTGPKKNYTITTSCRRATSPHQSN